MPTSLVMSPFGEFLGIEIESFGEGKALCSIAVKPHHFNAGGRVHGGVLTSLADSCAGVAVRSLRPEGVASATTDLNIALSDRLWVIGLKPRPKCCMRESACTEWRCECSV